MAVGTTELEIEFLKSQGAIGNSLNELRLSYYNYVLSTNYSNVNEARAAWLKSQAGGTLTSPSDLEQSYLYAKGVAHQNSPGDMWRSYYSGSGTIETAVAYWKASQKSGDYLVDLTGNGHDARFGSVGAARVINKGRAKYLRLPAVNGNYASTPDSAALSITGDITVDIKLALVDWTPGTGTDIFGKWLTTGNQRSYSLIVNTNGTLNFATSTDGTATVSHTSSVAPTVVDGGIIWLRASMDVDNGATEHVVKFYTSTDGVSWTQLGSTITTAGVFSIFDSTGVVGVSSRDNGTSNLVHGHVYQAKIYNSYLQDAAGTPVFNADFTNLADGATSFTESSANGATVTITSTSPADTNDPTYLEYTGTKYAYLPGIAGNYISTPDSVPLSVTGDIDVRVRVAMDDWTPAANQILLSKYSNASTGYSYLLYVGPTGVVTFTTSPTGAAADLVSGVSTVPTGVADGAVKWIRATLDVNDGAGNKVFKFYTSDNGSNWTQLGATVTSVGATSIFDSTAPVEVGTYLLGTGAALPGKVYRAQIRSNILDDGTGIVFDANLANATEPFSTFTESSSNAATVTFNRAATGKKLAIVDRTLALFGTDDYMDIQDQANLNIGASDNFTLVAVLRHYGLVGATALVAKDTALSGTIGYHLRTNASSKYVWNTHDGTNENETGNTTDYTAGVVQALTGVRDATSDIVVSYLDGGVLESETDVTTGTLSNTNVLRIGATSGAAASYGHFELIGMAVFRKALTPAQLTQVKTELGG